MSVVQHTDTDEWNKTKAPFFWTALGVAALVCRDNDVQRNNQASRRRGRWRSCLLVWGRDQSMKALKAGCPSLRSPTGMVPHFR